MSGLKGLEHFSGERAIGDTTTTDLSARCAAMGFEVAAPLHHPISSSRTESTAPAVVAKIPPWTPTT
jgi:hypothetical protein